MIGTMLLSALMQGMLYAPMALGVMIAFRILDTPDLTVDGSFVFGMTTCAMVTIAGHPVAGIFAGMIAGALAGLVTALLQTKLAVNEILAGILTMTGLYTVNFAVLGGQANRYLQDASGSNSATIYRSFQDLAASFPGGEAVWDSNLSALVLTTILVGLVTVLLAVFFQTKVGMSIRATGDNEEMVRSSSIDADAMRIIGIMLANALVGLSGAFLCQQQKYADLNCGTGMLVVGLASVIIGQVIFGKRSITIGLISAVAGSLFYRIVLQIAYKIDMPSYMVKLLSALIVGCALAMPVVKRKISETKNRRERAARPMAEEEIR